MRVNPKFKPNSNLNPNPNSSPNRITVTATVTVTLTHRLVWVLPVSGIIRALLDGRKPFPPYTVPPTLCLRWHHAFVMFPCVSDHICFRIFLGRVFRFFCPRIVFCDYWGVRIHIWRVSPNHKRDPNRLRNHV